MNPWWKRPAPEEDGGKGSRRSDDRNRRSDSSRGDSSRGDSSRSDSSRHDSSSGRQRQAGNKQQPAPAKKGGGGSGGGGRGPRRRRRGGRGSQRPERGNGALPEVVLCDGVTLEAALADLDIDVEEALSPLVRSLDAWNDAERIVFLSEDCDPDLRDELENAFEVVTVPSEEEVLLELAMAAAARAAEGESRRFVLVAEQSSVARITDKLRGAKHSVTHYVPGESVPDGGSPQRDDRGDRSGDRRGDDRGGRSRSKRGGRGRDDRRDSRPAGDGRSSGDRRDVSDSPEEAFEALQEAIGELAEGSNRIVWGTLVRQAVHESRPDFDERDYGFDSFDSLLEAAAERDLVRLERSPDTGSYFLSAWQPPAS